MTLIRQLDNGLIARTKYEGLLFVTLVAQQTGEKFRGTVCGHGFTRRAAQLFCRKMGYDIELGVWGNHSSYKYVSEYVSCQFIFDIARMYENCRVLLVRGPIIIRCPMIINLPG